MNLKILRAAFASLASFIGIYSGLAHATTYKFNVSERVTGTSQYVNWFSAELVAAIPCGSHCAYTSTSTSGIEIPDKRPSLEPHKWPPVLDQPLSLPPQVLENEPTVPNPPTYFNSDDYLRAEVARPGTTTYVSAHTFSSGRAESVTSTYIELDGAGQNGRAQFLEFSIPGSGLSESFAYDLVPGSNGGTYLYRQQNWSRARFSFDVVVNGLVVWSREELFNFWQDLSGSMFDGFDSEFGYGYAGGNKVVLFLGYIPPDERWDISLTIRTDVAADAPKCGKVYGTTAGLDSGESMVHCYELTQSADAKILARNLHQIVNVYSRDL